MRRPSVITLFVSGTSVPTASVAFVAYDSQETAAAAIDDDDLDAAIVLPAGFGAAVVAGSSATVTVLRDPRKEISAGVANSLSAQYLSSLESRRLASATVLALGGSMPSASELAAMRDSIATVLVDEEPGGSEVDASAYYGVSMSVLFLFFTVAFAARSLIVERKTGLVSRLLAASTPPWAIVLGKVLAVCVLGLVGFVTVWVATGLIFGADWGDPVGVVAAMCATVLAIGGVAVFICGLARTEQQADGWTSMVAFALALIGGNFVGPGQAPDALRRVAVFTPNGQALEAFTSLAVDGTGITGIAGRLVILVAIAAAFGGIGFAMLGRTMLR